MKPTLDNTPKPASLKKGEVSMTSKTLPAAAQAGVASVKKGS
jgi:hypothetical protein